MGRPKKKQAQALIGQDYRVKLTFAESILGSTPKDKDIYKSFIASKAALTDDQIKEELATVESCEQRGWTGFHKRQDGNPIIYDYVIKGFFKDACRMLRRAEGSESESLAAFVKVIDGLVFVFPRKIPIKVKGKMDLLERPLRANTPQGERVTLVRSDTCPEGSTMEFTIKVLDPKINESVLNEWLSYGSLRGLGGWRNGGFGRFSYEMEVM